MMDMLVIRAVMVWAMGLVLRFGGILSEGVVGAVTAAVILKILVRGHQRVVGSRSHRQ